ncbi:hypothetical protein [Lysobacter sp. HA35]
MELPAEQAWQVPTNPIERAAYEYSYALALPAGMPRPAPFDFRAARLVEGYGGKSVAQQYFEHLCGTEDAEVIAKAAEGVEGFQVLRPRPNMERSPFNRDRYAAEEPTGYGWLSDDNQLRKEFGGGLQDYVQPLSGIYAFVEYQEPASNAYYRVERSPAPDPEFEHGISGNWRPSDGGILEVPYVVRHTHIERITARYLYTWRGVRRLRDREFGIAGGEYLIVDKETGKVLGARRTFNSTFVPGNPGYTNWYAARECHPLQDVEPMPYFVRRVLHPAIGINDTYLPAAYRDEYRDSLKEKEKAGTAR